MAEMVSTMDLGTPVDCCIAMAPAFSAAKKKARNGVKIMLDLTIRAASIPLVPRSFAKLSR